jgi:UrcA family protein
MKTLTTLIAVATVAASGITIASADTTLEPRSATVKFADLNTSNVQGAQVLYQRIASAAESVCRDLKPGRQVALMEPYAKCVHQAISTAVIKVDRPAVTAYAAAQGTRPSEAAIKIARNQ